MLTARRLVVAGILALATTGACTTPAEPTTQSSSTLFDNQDCLNRIDKMMAEAPGIYTSRQDAYDSCRDAQQLLNEIKGSVTTQP